MLYFVEESVRRWSTHGMALGVGAVVLSLQVSTAWAEEERKTGERVLTRIISGLLGQPQQSLDATDTAQEQERLVSLLQSGE